MELIDLRSDTVTMPTNLMYEAMQQARLGDDARDGDPTVVELETIAAERVGKEAALFMASGTMANLVATLSHTQLGAEVVLESTSHLLNSEVGGIAALAGLIPRPIDGDRGAMNLCGLQGAIRKESRSSCGTKLIVLENTHNAAGGAILPLDHIAAVYKIAQDNGIPVHTDGARLFNAAIGLRVDVKQIASYTDSLCFCISKGLSAPVGALLAGSKSYIEHARKFRRMVGGNLRQAGILAAAGIVAIGTMVDRLAEDHGTARALAKGLNHIDERLVDPGSVETNIVRVNVRASNHEAIIWSRELKNAGVLVSPYGPYVLRFVTHRHISCECIDQVCGAFGALWQKLKEKREP